ncbi:MAG: carbonic anhydrase [Burkholderiales bacterium]
MCTICGDVQHEPAVSRRAFLAAGAATALATWGVGAALAADAPAPGAPPPPNAIAPAEALKRLMDGNARYAANTPNQRDFSSGRAARAQGQYPIAAILSCADSRVVPDLVFDQNPGDLFVVRVAGNIVSPDLLASLEYGVRFLGAPLIMVVGHSGCGAVDAAIKVLKTKAVLPGHLPELITAIKPAVVVAEKTASGNLLDNAIAENVRRQVARLKTSPPVVQGAYASKKIDIVGGVYDIATGKVTPV